MKKNGGFTLVELMVLATFLLIFVVGVGGFVVNNRGATERRANKAADRFIEENHLKVLRKTCAGDSDHDGYGTCTLRIAAGKGDTELVSLRCPTNWFDTVVWGAKSCKEVTDVHALSLNR